MRCHLTATQRSVLPAWSITTVLCCGAQAAGGSPVEKTTVAEAAELHIHEKNVKSHARIEEEHLGYCQHLARIYLIAILNEIVRHKRCLENFDFSRLSAASAPIVCLNFISPPLTVGTTSEIF